MPARRTRPSKAASSWWRGSANGADGRTVFPRRPPCESDITMVDPAKKTRSVIGVVGGAETPYATHHAKRNAPRTPARRGGTLLSRFARLRSIVGFEGGGAISAAVPLGAKDLDSRSPACRL